MQQESVEVGVERGVVGVRDIAGWESAQMLHELGIGDGSDEFGGKSVAAGDLASDLGLVHPLVVAEALELAKDDDDPKGADGREEKDQADAANPSPLLEGVDESLYFCLVSHRGAPNVPFFGDHSSSKGTRIDD